MSNRLTTGVRLKQFGMLLLAIGAVCIGVAVRPIAHASAATVTDVQGSIYTAPFDTTVALGHGNYLLLESQDGSAQLHPAEMRITGPAGSELTVQQADGSHTVIRNGERFVDVVSFTADRAGRYDLEVAFPPNARLIVGRRHSGSSASGWYVIGGLGALLALAGAVALLAGFARRRAVPC